MSNYVTAFLPVVTPQAPYKIAVGYGNSAITVGALAEFTKNYIENSGGNGNGGNSEDSRFTQTCVSDSVASKSKSSTWEQLQQDHNDLVSKHNDLLKSLIESGILKDCTDPNRLIINPKTQTISLEDFKASGAHVSVQESGMGTDKVFWQVSGIDNTLIRKSSGNSGRNFSIFVNEGATIEAPLTIELTANGTTDNQGKATIYITG